MRSSRALLSIWLAVVALIVGFSTNSFASSKAGLQDGSQDIQKIEKLKRFSAELGSNWALADLDGDHQPDFAQGRRVGHSKSGYLYRVDLKLSLDQALRSFTFTDSDAMNVRIDAIDVDGDNDLDLVISDLPFGHKIGVWINDGNGVFERQSADLYPAAFSATSLDAVHWNGLGSSVFDSAFRQLLLVLPRENFTPILSFAAAQLTSQSDCRRQFLASSARFRAPPLQS
jgi:hypothetical protein